MLGARKSCRILVRFKFKINQSEEVASNIFEVYIRNPVGSNFDGLYKDGDEVRRQLNNIHTEAGETSLTFREKKDIRGDLESFPFLKKNEWLI
ncbi:hypothetical protein D9M71_748570 [compost metagenome]